jgi:hypothetical protein
MVLSALATIEICFRMRPAYDSKKSAVESIQKSRNYDNSGLADEWVYYYLHAALESLREVLELCAGSLSSANQRRFGYTQT